MQETLKVLLIDDHPLMRRGIKQLVELDDNFEVIADVGSGAEGISVALQTSPDLIILDLNMKGLSGLDTLKGLRAEGVDARIVGCLCRRLSTQRHRAGYLARTT